MGSRGNESGMDFEYENKTGPMDPQSPFARVAQRNEGYGRKRPYNAFESPNKSPNKSGVAAFNSLYTTPRKSKPEFDDSSAGETPRSVDPMDSDATPELRQTGRALTNFSFASTQNTSSAAAGANSSPSRRDQGSPMKEKQQHERPSPQRRESWLIRGMKKAFSPGRGEIARPSHSGAVEKQVKRRREKGIHRQVARRRRHSVSDSGEDDGDDRQKSANSDASGTKQHWLSAMFTFIAQHPTVPHILSFYAQLLFNIFLLAGCAYLIYCFWAAVQGDVDKKSHEAMGEIMAEMAICAKSYRENRCDPSTRLPALETVCNNWHKCMNQDPSRVGRAKVSAHTFAEIFNSFVEPISWKAMIFTFGLVFACFFTTNMAFGIFRDKTTNAGPQFQPGGGYYPPPPPTPQRMFSNPSSQDAAALGYYGSGNNPWHQPPMQLEPQPSPGKYGQIEGRSSPVRMLKYS